MTREELGNMLHELPGPVYEGITAAVDTNTYPRTVFWPYVFDDGIASGDTYVNLDTYQVSHYHLLPPEKDFIPKLRKILRREGIYTTIFSEYVEEDKCFHTYFALQIEEIPDE